MTNLIILAFLRDRPMHGYEIQQMIQTSRMDTWANLLSGSIYYALNKMEKEGLIEAVAEERTGARLRKIYGITKQGEQLFRQLIEDAVKLPPHSVKSDFVAALNWIETLPKEQALAYLDQNLAQLEETLALWRLGRSLKSEHGLTPIAEACFDNAIALLELDISFVQKVKTLL